MGLLRLRRDNYSGQSGITITLNNATDSVDLDSLVTICRENPDAPLTLQVIDNNQTELLQTAYSTLVDEIGKTIDGALSDTVKNEMTNIINSVLDSYGYVLSKDTYNTRYFLEVVSEDISKKISAYLNSLPALPDEFKGRLTTLLKFNITKDGEIDVNIDYDLSDNEVKASKLLEIYRRIADNTSEVNNIQVGGLAIKSGKDVKVRMTNEDFQKYLLEDEKSTNGYVEPGLRKPLIIWTDATEDPNMANTDPMSLLDQIDYLKQTIKELSENYNGEKIPEPPEDVGNYILTVKVTSNGNEKIWVRKDSFNSTDIILEKDLNRFFNTYIAYIGASTTYDNDTQTYSLNIVGIEPVLITSDTSGTFAINGNS